MKNEEQNVTLCRVHGSNIVRFLIGQVVGQIRKVHIYRGDGGGQTKMPSKKMTKSVLFRCGLVGRAENDDKYAPGCLRNEERCMMFSEFVFM